MPLSLDVFTAASCVTACETLVGCVSCDVFKELVTTAVMGKWRGLNTGAELSSYQSECDVWSAAAAALTGLPAYPRLTCPFHPFCLFLHCSSTPSSIIPCVSGCDDPIQMLKPSISPGRMHLHPCFPPSRLTLPWIQTLLCYVSQCSALRSAPFSFPLFQCQTASQ